MINDLDISKIVVSNKLPFGKEDFKYFSGCKGSEKIKALFIFYPQMNIYKKFFDENTHLFF